MKKLNENRIEWIDIKSRRIKKVTEDKTNNVKKNGIKRREKVTTALSR